MATAWPRVWATEQPWAVGHLLIAILEPGQTLARVHFGARWTGISSNAEDFQTLADDFMAFGVCTQSSATGPTPPNALTQATDVNPPLERWTWWATSQLQPRTFGSEHPDVTMWCTDTTITNQSTKGQVKANVAAGQTLNVFLSWAPWVSTIWGSRGNVTGQMWASTLTLL